MNIFDTSSYGSVPMRNFLGQAKNPTTASIAMKGVNPDASVSMCEMQDSIAFDDPKAFTNNLGARPINGTVEGVSPP